jgi:C-terminal processing protease CtpA/Prc
VFMLVSGENSSAGFQLARLAQQARVATLVGQTTGGNLRGLNAGELAWLTLPNSGVAIDIPLLAHVYAADTPDKSVVPDIVVTRTFAGQSAGQDEEMAAVKRGRGL